MAIYNIDGIIYSADSMAEAQAQADRIGDPNLHQEEIAKEKKRAENKAAIEQLTITHAGNEYEADDKSLIRITAKINILNDESDKNCQWKMKDNQWKTVSVDDLKTVQQLAMGKIAQLLVF